MSLNVKMCNGLKMYFWATGRNFQPSLDWKLKRKKKNYHTRCFVMVLSLSDFPREPVFKKNCNTGLSFDSSLFLLSCKTQSTWCTFVRHGLDLGDQHCPVLQPNPGGCARNSFLCLSGICGLNDPRQKQRVIKQRVIKSEPNFYKTRYVHFLQGAWCLSGCSPGFTSYSCM